MNEDRIAVRAFQNKAAVTANEVTALTSRAEGSSPQQLCEAYAILSPILPKIAEISLQRVPFWVRMISGSLLPVLLSILGSYMSNICSEGQGGESD